MEPFLYCLIVLAGIAVCFIVITVLVMFVITPSDTISQTNGVDTEATVVALWSTREGLSESEDSDMLMHYWTYEYEYSLPGTDEIKKHQETINFIASGYGIWFEKYPIGFKFPIRYDKTLPSKHIKLNNFDFD